MRTPTGWTRCVCLGPTLDHVFIRPGLRGGLSTYPAEFDQVPPFPLQDLTVGGKWSDLQAFKFRAWRSLAPFRDRALRYDYMDAYRLVDIHFERDTDYEYLRQLVSLDLLVLVLGLADVPNKLLPSLIVQTLTLRRDAARPTWVFAPFSKPRVAENYGGGVADLLGDVSPVLGTTPVAVALSEVSGEAATAKQQARPWGVKWKKGGPRP